MLIMILFDHPCHYTDFSAMTNFEDGTRAAEKQHQKRMVIKSNRCQRHKSYNSVRGNDDSHLCLCASAKGKQFLFLKFLRNNIIKQKKTSKLLLNFLCGVCSNPSKGLAPSIS